MEHTPAVILGLSPTGLYAARELGRAGIPVIGVASEVQAGLASRYLTERVVEPDPVRRLQRLLDIGSGRGVKPVLNPTSDQDIDFLSSHADYLSPAFAFQSSYLDGKAEIMLTKERFYGVCEQSGVAYPRLWKAHPEQIEALRSEVTFPCLIKPSRIHEIKSRLAGKKGWVVGSEREFMSVIGRIPNDAGMLLLQEIVPGPESEITLYASHVDREGKPCQPFSARKLRQYPPGFGSASLVRSNPEPESRELAERLLGGIGYHGIAAAEFKRDPRDGQLKIIEINARPSLWFSASSAAGKFITLAAYHELAQTGVRVDEGPQMHDVCWRYVGKDLYSAVFYRCASNFVLPPPDVSSARKARKRVRAVFDPADPAPTVAETVNMMRKSLRFLSLPGDRKSKRVEHDR